MAILVPVSLIYSKMFISDQIYVNIYLNLDGQVDVDLIEKRNHGEDFENAVMLNDLHSFSDFICSSCPPLTQMIQVNTLSFRV